MHDLMNSWRNHLQHDANFGYNFINGSSDEKPCTCAIACPHSQVVGVGVEVVGVGKHSQNGDVENNIYTIYNLSTIQCYLHTCSSGSETHTSCK